LTDKQKNFFFLFEYSCVHMQWSTTTSLHDLHIIDNVNNIVRWHRMSQCPICLQPIPFGNNSRKFSSTIIFEFDF